MFAYFINVFVWSLVLAVKKTAPFRRLRSADSRTLVVGRTQSSFGDRTFAAVASQLWNSLPSDIRQPDLSYGQFRWSLKTFFGGCKVVSLNLAHPLYRPKERQTRWFVSVLYVQKHRSNSNLTVRLTLRPMFRS